MGYRRKISRLGLAAIIIAGLLTGLAIGLVAAVGQNLPQVVALEDFEPGATTRIYSEDNVLLAELYTERRTPLPLDKIPRPLQEAVVAVEDRRFFRHPGTDLIRIVGAALRDISSMSLAQGGSTITQQLARNLFLSSEKTLPRKLKEVFLAWQIERRYTKQEILRLYLNNIYFGAGAYGVSAAADYYFGKNVSDLSLGECALLAGLPQLPELYKPDRYPDRALSRRRVVLKAMVRAGYITSGDAEKAAEEPLAITGHSRKQMEKAPDFVRRVRDRLVELFGENAVYKGGLTVRTTLDFRLQQAAESALKSGLSNLALQISESDGKPSESGALEELPQGALVAMETGSGTIKAWVGGVDHPGQASGDEPDRVAEVRHPPGDLFKPFIYAAAIQSGMTQADLIWDAPISYTLPGRDTPWEPMNYSRRYEGEIPLRRALEISGNIPAAKLLSRIGVDKVINFAQSLGVTSPLKRDITLALGSSETTLLEITAAYNVFADGGLWVEPHGIKEVLDRSGRTIHRARPERRAALAPETAYIATDMLQGVVEGGTAQRAETLGKTVAGQTGQTEDMSGALFCGYSPSILAGVWIGMDSGRPIDPAMSVSRTALPIWIEFMTAAISKESGRDFNRPAGVVMAPFNRFTGKPCAPDDPAAVMGAFLSGSEPRSP